MLVLRKPTPMREQWDCVLIDGKPDSKAEMLHIAKSSIAQLLEHEIFHSLKEDPLDPNKIPEVVQADVRPIQKDSWSSYMLHIATSYPRGG